MQRNSSWPGESTLHTKAEYICADLSNDPSLFPCSQTADHTLPGMRLGLTSTQERKRHADVVLFIHRRGAMQWALLID
jgi:hypothetical protein